MGLTGMEPMMIAIDASSLGIFLSKAVAALLLPAGSTLVLLAGAFVQSARARWASARRLIAAAFVVVALSSNPIFAAFAIATVERQYPPLAIEDLPVADVAVVLGGGVRDLKPPRRVVEVESGGNRVLFAARLFRAGKVSRIIATGGNLADPDDPLVEADLTRSLLIEWGVPDAAILVERKSRTTYENALYTRDIWLREGFRSGLLVTSAHHLPRAVATFRGAGLDLHPASVDVHAAGPLIDSVYALIPSGDAFRVTTYAVREWIGRFGYAVLRRGG